MRPLTRNRWRKGTAGGIAAVVAAAGLGLTAPAAYAGVGSQAPANSTGSPAPAEPAPAKLPAGSPTLSDGNGLTAAQQQAVDQAVSQAKATAEPVVVNALTTETWQISALPSGGLSLADNTLPVRTEQHGTWVPVDTTLHRTSSGSYSPAATAYATVSFSGGGTTLLASTTTASGASYQLSWPTRLPTPTVNGSAAVYPDVLPGVDLEVSANAAGGFGEDLIVHSATAAANPALAKLTFGVHTTGTHQSSGALAETADGMTLTMSGASMWDSNTTPAPATLKAAGAKAPITGTALNPTLAQIAASDPSTPGNPGYAAHQSFVKVTATDSALTLVPDPALLTGKSTVFPLDIDPTLVWHTPTMSTPAFDEVKQGSPCNSQSFYNDYHEDGNGTTLAELGVGYTNTYCSGIQRTYYQWALPSVLHGATIEPDSGSIYGAAVNATEDWQASFSCSYSRTVNLHWAGGIGSGTDYNNQPGYLTGANAYSTSKTVGAAYNPSGCTNPATSAVGFDVTSPIQWSATNNASAFTVALAQDGSTNYAAFDRFAQNPTLNILFDHAPTTPVASQLSAASGASDVAGCTTSAPYPYIGASIATNSATLTAAGITSPDGDQLQATFKYWPTSTPTNTATGTSANNIASGQSATYSLPSTFTTSLTTGENVSWQVQTTNGILQSAWSPACTFTAEPTAPGQPTVAANTTYPRNSLGAAAGTSATFQLSATGTTATKFYYNLGQPPATSGTPASETATATSNAASVTVTPYAAGAQTLYVDAVDAAGDVSATASYTLIAAGHTTHTCTSLAACYNNTAISPNATPSDANADGSGNSISATDLTNADWTSSGHVTVDGASLALPAFGSGQADNILAANQTIDYSYTTPNTGASSLVFLATATNATMAEPESVLGDYTAPYVPAQTGVAGAYAFNGTVSESPVAPMGTINYTTGTPTPYILTVPDWSTGPSSLAAIVLPHHNNPAGQQNSPAKIYAFSVPLPTGATLSSIVLPDLTSSPGGPTLHIFSIGTRNTTTGTVESTGSTLNTTGANTWTGAWASDTEGTYNFESGNFSNQSFRVLLQPSVTGGVVRIKLDNSLGSSPLDIGHITVSPTTGNDITPTAALPATPTNLTFGGSASTVIPEGGMVYTDPLTFTTTAGQWLAVSFDITNTVPYLVEHSWTTDSYEYVAPANSGDHTTDTAATEYTASGNVNGTFTDLVTGLDVQTTGMPTQLVLGDNLIDARQPNTAPLSPNNGAAERLSDDLADASPTTPQPYGTINAGIESNQLIKDNPEIISGTSQAYGGPALLSRIDRDVLDEPGINTVIIDEGLEDALATTDATTIDDAYTSLLNYLSATETSNTGALVNTIAIGLTPCDTYNGDGAASPNNDPCTTTVDGVRDTVNAYLNNNPDGLNAYSTPPVYYIDSNATIGVPDGTSGRTELAPLAMVGTSRGNSLSDPVNLSNAGTGALANAILAAQDIWQLNDGTGSTTAADQTVANANDYLATTNPNLNAGGYPLDLNGTITWNTGVTIHNQTGITDPALDGSTNYGVTETSNILDTQNSFSISAWANLTTIPTQNATIAAESGTQAAGYYLQYNAGQPGWCMAFMNSDTLNAEGLDASPCASTTVTTGTWYHLVGVYNAIAHTAALYINGTLAGTGTGITNWNATGLTTIGAAQYNATLGDYFPGQLSNIQSFNYALTPPQITALYDQIQ